MRVIPVAGSDSMLLNLSGAHAPYFTRNVVLLTDDAGHTGAGEVPGGASIRQVLRRLRTRFVIMRAPADRQQLALVPYAHRGIRTDQFL